MSNKPTFVSTAQAWYADSALDALHERIIISSVDRSGELWLEWKDADSAPVLVVHHDSWGVMLRDFTGILRHVAHQKGPAAAPAEVQAYLLRMGFEDATQREKTRAPVVALRRPHRPC